MLSTMINIISRALISNTVSGPQKVVINLIKGLEILNYPYCINKELNSTSQLWIHDDKYAFKKASEQKIKAVVGPNIYILPRNIPENLDLSNFLYIHPSEWAVNFWKYLGFDKCKLDFWPAGIDTNEFVKREKPEKGKVLVYFKQRYIEELNFLEEILKKKKINYTIIHYGSYTQKQYLEELKNTKYIIWLGRQESQGIALEEALSMNVPILVWDVEKVGHWKASPKEMNIFNNKEAEYTGATSAFYFDNRCGIIIKRKNELEKTIEKMNQIWESFDPRAYIIENLNLKKQALDFIKLYEKNLHIPYEKGLTEKQKNNKAWRNVKWYYVLYIKMKKLIKKIVGKII
jgi:hypothetical protein